MSDHVGGHPVVTSLFVDISHLYNLLTTQNMCTVYAASDRAYIEVVKGLQLKLLISEYVAVL